MYSVQCIKSTECECEMNERAGQRENEEYFLLNLLDIFVYIIYLIYLIYLQASLSCFSQRD